jgi:hypothetical protein
MRSARLFAVAVLAVLMVASMFQPVAAHVGTLDQQQTLIDYSGGLYYTYGPGDYSQFLGQTFTAGLTGDLTEVDLAFGCWTSATGVTTCASNAPVTVEIHSDSPTGALLASTSLPGSAFLNFYPSDYPSVFVTFIFSTPPAVVAGSVYAIVMTTTQVHGVEPYYGDGESSLNPYGGGTAWFTDAGGWHSVSENDVAFKTYVVLPPPPEPVSGPVGGVVIPANTLALVAPWLAVIGLVGCIGTVVVVAKKRR